MNTTEVTYDHVLDLARHLKPGEQAQLISQLAATIKHSLESQEAPKTPRQSLRGLLADLGPAPSSEEIDEARREMWGNFPREDF